LKASNFCFGKYLNLLEFDNAFDSNSNLGFKFKICWKEIRKVFLFISAQPNQFSPLALEAHLVFYFLFCFHFPPAQLPTLLTRLPAHRPIASFLSPQSAAANLPGCPHSLWCAAKSSPALDSSSSICFPSRRRSSYQNR
jgi:hypothetical protein